MEISIYCHCISFLVHSSLRDCSARFLCVWSLHSGNDYSVYGIEPSPSEVKNKVVDFLGSEVSSLKGLCQVILWC